MSADTQTHRHTDTQTHRHPDTQTHRHTNTQTRAHAHTRTRAHAHTRTCHSDTQTHRHSDIQTHRHTDTQTHTHTYRQLMSCSWSPLQGTFQYKAIIPDPDHSLAVCCRTTRWVHCSRIFSLLIFSSSFSRPSCVDDADVYKSSL